MWSVTFGPPTLHPIRRATIIFISQQRKPKFRELSRLSKFRKLKCGRAGVQIQICLTSKFLITVSYNCLNWQKFCPWAFFFFPEAFWFSDSDDGKLLATAKSLQSYPTLCDPRQQPTRLPVPGILQARTLEWVAISFSNAWKWKTKVKSLSRVWLLVAPWTAAYQAPPSMGFSRQEYWSGLPLPSPYSYLGNH